MQLGVYFVDAFVTGRPFTGNRTAVCPLDAERVTIAGQAALYLTGTISI
jgi:hypothetical protein